MLNTVKLHVFCIIFPYPFSYLHYTYFTCALITLNTLVFCLHGLMMMNFPKIESLIELGPIGLLFHIGYCYANCN